MTRWTWVLSLLLIGAGCDQGYPQRCCADEAGRPVVHGMGRVSQCTCASNAICEYSFFDTCVDDESRCVVTFQSVHDVRCGEGEPVIDAPCCVERGDDGVGTRATCECPVFGVCEGGLRGEHVEAIDESQCRLRPSPWVDAGMTDGGS